MGSGHAANAKPSLGAGSAEGFARPPPPSLAIAPYLDWVTPATRLDASRRSAPWARSKPTPRSQQARGNIGICSANTPATLHKGARPRRGPDRRCSGQTRGQPQQKKGMRMHPPFSFSAINRAYANRAYPGSLPAVASQRDGEFHAEMAGHRCAARVTEELVLTLAQHLENADVIHQVVGEDSDAPVPVR